MKILQKINNCIIPPITRVAKKRGFILPRRYKKGEKYEQKFSRDNIDKFLYFQKMLNRIADVEGDIVECGIGRGKTFQMLALLAEREEKERRLWGFDSFEGFPEPSDEDRNNFVENRDIRRGGWHKMNESDVFDLLDFIKINKDFVNNNIRIVKGFFEKSLPHAGVQKIALLHLDVDLYSSYKDCLNHLFPKIASGGVVLFDERESEVYPGGKKAIDEFFHGTPYLHKIEKDRSVSRHFLVKI